MVRDISARTLVRFVTGTSHPGAVVLTDGFGATPPFRRWVTAIDHASKAPTREWRAGSFPESTACSEPQDLLRGTHHGVGHPHLQAYLDEFTFRFNRRRTPMAAFQTLLGLGSLHQPTTYNQLYRVEPNG